MLILYSFYFACFIEYLSFTFNYGNVFDFYKKYLIDKFYKGESVNLLEQDLYIYKEQQIESKWYKVLVGCKYCYQFWLSIPFYFIVVKMGISLFFIFVSINYIILKIFDYVKSNFEK